MATFTTQNEEFFYEFEEDQPYAFAFSGFISDGKKYYVSNFAPIVHMNFEEMVGDEPHVFDSKLHVYLYDRLMEKAFEQDKLIEIESEIVQLKKRADEIRQSQNLI